MSSSYESYTDSVSSLVQSSSSFESSTEESSGSDSTGATGTAGTKGTKGTKGATGKKGTLTTKGDKSTKDMKGTLTTKGGKSKKGSKKGTDNSKGKNSKKGSKAATVTAGDISSSDDVSGTQTGTQVSGALSDIGGSSLMLPPLSTQGTGTTETTYLHGDTSAASSFQSKVTTPSASALSKQSEQAKYRYGDKSPEYRGSVVTGASSLLKSRRGDTSTVSEVTRTTRQTDTKFRYGDRSPVASSGGLSGSTPSGASDTKYRYGDRSPAGSSGGPSGTTPSGASDTKYRYGDRSPGGPGGTTPSGASDTKYRYGDRSPGGPGGTTSSGASDTKYRYGDRSPGGPGDTMTSGASDTKYRYGDRSSGGPGDTMTSEASATKYRYGDRSTSSSSVDPGSIAVFPAGGRGAGRLPYEPSGGVRRSRYSAQSADGFHARPPAKSFGQMRVNAQMQQEAFRMDERSPYGKGSWKQDDQASSEAASSTRFSGAQLPLYRTRGSSSSGSTLGSREHSVSKLSLGSVPSIRGLAHNLNSLTSPRGRLERGNIVGRLDPEGEAYRTQSKSVGEGRHVVDDGWYRPVLEADLKDDPYREMIGDWNQKRSEVGYSADEKYDVPSRGALPANEIPMGHPTMVSDWIQDRRTEKRPSGDWDASPDEYYQRAGGGGEYGRPIAGELPFHQNVDHRPLDNIVTEYNQPKPDDHYRGADAGGKYGSATPFCEDNLRGSLKNIVTEHRQRGIRDPRVPPIQRIAYERYPTPRAPEGGSVRTGHRSHRSHRPGRSHHTHRSHHRTSPSRLPERGLGGGPQDETFKEREVGDSGWNGGWGGGGWRDGGWGGGWRDYGWKEDKKSEEAGKEEPLKMLPCGALMLPCGATIPCSAINPGQGGCPNTQSPCSGEGARQPVHTITAAPRTSPVVPTSPISTVMYGPSATTTRMPAPAICGASPAICGASPAICGASPAICGTSPAICGVSPPCLSPLSAPAAGQVCVPQSEQPCTIRIFCKDGKEAETSPPPKVQAEAPVVEYDRGFRDGRAKGFAKGHGNSIVKEPERPPVPDIPLQIKQYDREVQTSFLCDAGVQSVEEVKESKKEVNVVAGDGSYLSDSAYSTPQDALHPPSRRRTTRRTTVRTDPTRDETLYSSARSSRYPSHRHTKISARERDFPSMDNKRRFMPEDYREIPSDRYEDYKRERDFWDRECKRQSDLERERGLNIMRNGIQNPDYWVAGRRNDPTHAPTRLLMPHTAGSQPPPPLIIEEHVYDEDASIDDGEACHANQHSCSDVLYVSEPCSHGHCGTAIEPCYEQHCENTTPPSLPPPRSRSPPPQPQPCAPTSLTCDDEGEYYYDEPPVSENQYWLPGYYPHNDCVPGMSDEIAYPPPDYDGMYEVQHAEPREFAGLSRRHYERPSFLDEELDDDLQYVYDETDYGTSDDEEVAPGVNMDSVHYESAYGGEQDVGTAAYYANGYGRLQDAPNSRYDTRNATYYREGVSQSKQRRGNGGYSTQRHSLNSGQVLTLQPSNRMAAAQSTVVPGKVARITR